MLGHERQHGHLAGAFRTPLHRRRLDGNPVPVPTTVDVVKLDVAERADVIVEMNDPGVWVFGSTDDDHNMGMGVVAEYADWTGKPRWGASGESDLSLYGLQPKRPPTNPDETVDLKYGKIPGGRRGYNRWAINGTSWPDTNPLFTVQQDKRYRLVMNNNSGDEHPVHLHPHNFEITKVGERTTSGIIKETISMPRYSKAGIDFIADDPGNTFFH